MSNNYEMTKLSYPQMILMLSILSSSVSIVMSTDSFLGMWIGIELNLFFFIPFFMFWESFNSEKSMILYFSMQTISSTIMLMSMLIMSFLDMMFMKMIIYLAMFMKIGLFPFHQWMISMISNMSYKTILILSTLQKMSPIMVMYTVFDESYLTFFVGLCLLNMFIASLTGLTTLSVRKILGFSSMNHMTFMLLSLMISKSMFTFYFVTYFFLTLGAIFTLEEYDINYYFQMLSLYGKSKLYQVMYMNVFFSFMGIPPFLGFLPKILVLIKLVELHMYIEPLLIVLFTTMGAFFYLRLCMPNLLIVFPKTLFCQQKHQEKTWFPLLYILVTPMIMTLY